MFWELRVLGAGPPRKSLQWFLSSSYTSSGPFKIETCLISPEKYIKNKKWICCSCTQNFLWFRGYFLCRPSCLSSLLACMLCIPAPNSLNNVYFSKYVFLFQTSVLCIVSFEYIFCSNSLSNRLKSSLFCGLLFTIQTLVFLLELFLHHLQICFTELFQWHWTWQFISLSSYNAGTILY